MTITERAPQSNEKYSIRFPDGLRNQIKAAAATNNRTINAEIIHRLEASGKTLRDEFAMAALGPLVAAIIDGRRQGEPDLVANEAYFYADAMMASRKIGGA